MNISYMSIMWCKMEDTLYYPNVAHTGHRTLQPEVECLQEQTKPWRPAVK
jgi:hypothetical protein